MNVMENQHLFYSQSVQF